MSKEDKYRYRIRIVHSHWGDTYYPQYLGLFGWRSIRWFAEMAFSCGSYGYKVNDTRDIRKAQREIAQHKQVNRPYKREKPIVTFIDDS